MEIKATHTPLLFVLILALVSGGFSVTFVFRNNWEYTIWLGTVTGGNNAQLSSTGFELDSGASQSIDAPAGWSGRFWARTYCSYSNGSFKCDTADCGTGQVACNGAGASPPATLVEFTIGSTSTEQDFYDINLVDGFNLPVSVTPVGGTGQCTSLACSADINSVCPSELSVKGSDGNTIACKSACTTFGTDQYCCTGSHNTAKTCPPTNYSEFFEQQCPQAYSYPYDDRANTFTCTGANYLLTFYPTSHTPSRFCQMITIMSF